MSMTNKHISFHNVPTYYKILSARSLHVLHKCVQSIALSLIAYTWHIYPCTHWVFMVICIILPHCSAMAITNCTLLPTWSLNASCKWSNIQLDDRHYYTLHNTGLRLFYLVAHQIYQWYFVIKTNEGVFVVGRGDIMITLCWTRLPDNVNTRRVNPVIYVLFHYQSCVEITSLCRRQYVGRYNDYTMLD